MSGGLTLFWAVVFGLFDFDFDPDFDGYPGASS